MSASRIDKYRTRILDQLDALLELAGDPANLELRREAAQWLRFAGIHHHHHHWKIIRGIRRAG